MTLISGTIPSLVNGVSQQPPSIRLPTQGEAMDNGYCSLAEGLMKRPPSECVAKLTGDNVTRGVHFIERDETEKYVVLFGSETIDVRDFAGNFYPVQAPFGGAYLQTPDPVNDIKALTIADTTFIVNRRAKVLVGENTPAPSIPLPYVVIWVKAGTYGANYRVRIMGNVFNYRTPKSTAVDAEVNISTDKIAQALRDLIAATLNSSNGWDWTVQDNHILGRRLVPLTGLSGPLVEVADGNGDRNMSAVYNKVQRFSDLPRFSVDGHVVQIIGDVESGSDDYFVKFRASTLSAPSGSEALAGVWEECPATSARLYNDLLHSTMPHVMVRKQDDAVGSVTGTPYRIYFQFTRGPWTSRVCGDLTSNPPPSFVNQRVSDMFLYRNRLGFLSDTNIILSQAGEFYNFWRQTQTTVKDDDPIDVTASHPKVVQLRHAVPYNEELLVFGDRVQFVLTAQGNLTPATARLNAATEFGCDPYCRPVPAENLVYFAYENGSHAGVREYFTDPQNSTKDAAAITGHVPTYMPGRPLRLSVSPVEDVMALTCAGQRSVLYVYKWLWAGNEKLQSSWSRWLLAATEDSGNVILGHEFVGSSLYVVTMRSGGTYLERIKLDGGQTDANADYITHLDQRMADDKVDSVSFNGLTNEVTYTLPYSCEGEMVVASRMTSGGGQTPGVVYKSTQGVNTVTVKGDPGPVWIGRRYEMRYRFSPAQVRAPSSQGGVVAVDGTRLQVRTWSVTYRDTGYFRAEVTPLYRDTSRAEFTGRVVGSSNNRLGELPNESGKFRFLVGSKSDQVTIDLVNDSILPCHIISAEWEAMFTQRARRV